LLIPVVEQGLEKLLRDALPLPEHIGDVSFDPPSRTWAAQLSRVTVNLLLFGVGRSGQPPRASGERIGPDGRVERRPPLPMVELNYLVSAWAGNVRDEHELLGDVLSCIVTNQVLPSECLSVELPATVQIALAPQDHGRAKDVFAAVDGSLRASFEIVVTTALDGLDWHEVAPRVERITALAAPMPSSGAASTGTR
jgi:hypothetical protein